MNINEYNLVWNDEFDYEGKLDSKKWNYETGNFQWPNRELQAYTDRLDNVFVKDGHLTIRSLKQKDGDREYTSGKVNTLNKGMWTYGYFEFRAKVPRGVGSWPAIWMMPYIKPHKLPDGIPTRPDGRPDFFNMSKEQRAILPPIPENDHWPNCGEIDILEHIGRLKKHLLFSLHSKNHNHTRKDGIQYTTNVTFDVDFSDDFHVYAMEWTKDYIEYFVDGKSYCRYNKTDDTDQSPDSWPFDKPFYLILNTAVGGGLGGPVDDSNIPFEFIIDYVRVYQKK